MKSNTKVINLFGGPGTGKSTIAAGVFYHLKSNNISCELVTEVAKDMVYENTTSLLQNQILIFAEQYRRQFRLIDKVDYIITDSPLLLSAVYFDEYLQRVGSSQFSDKYLQQTRMFFTDTFKEFNNINFLVERTIPYDPNGRVETKEQALLIDIKVKQELQQHHHISIRRYPEYIVDEITKKILTYQSL